MPSARPRSIARRHPGRRPSRRFALVVSAVLALIAFFAMAWAQSRSAAAARIPPMSTGACRISPAFTTDTRIVGGFGQGAAIALATDRLQKGLVLLTSHPGSEPFQHQTWDDAGFLGAFAYDDQGNVYVAPTPRTSLADNPLGGQATIWKVDSTTAEMRPFVTLQRAASERNPYGVLSLAYACELAGLYAGTVLGSTPAAELGGVVRIEPGSGAQTPVLEGVDVLSVLVVRQGDRFILYAGLARRPEIIALTLDRQGRPVGEPRRLIDLTQAGATPGERARKLQLLDGHMMVDLVPFNYTLQASASDRPQIRRAGFVWDSATGNWVVEQTATTP